MSRCEGLGQGLDNLPRLPKARRYFIQERGQGLAFNKSGDQEVVIAVAAHFVKRHNVGMVQPDCRLGLTQKAFEQPRVGSNDRLGNFEGDLAVVLRVICPVDLPETALAEQTAYVKTANLPGGVVEGFLNAAILGRRPCRR